MVFALITAAFFCVWYWGFELRASYLQGRYMLYHLSHISIPLVFALITVGLYCLCKVWYCQFSLSAP
jgi:hypothetical protein